MQQHRMIQTIFGEEYNRRMLRLYYLLTKNAVVQGQDSEAQALATAETTEPEIDPATGILPSDKRKEKQRG